MPLGGGGGDVQHRLLLLGPAPLPASDLDKGSNQMPICPCSARVALVPCECYTKGRARQGRPRLPEQTGCQPALPGRSWGAVGISTADCFRGVLLSS